jgi:hypothetical protein
LGAKQPYDISYTDAAALARCAGLRNAGDRVRSALANGEIEGDRRGATMWTMRRNFEAWLERALADDRAEDSCMLKIDQARAMAAAAGLKSSSARVLTAVSTGEINGCFKDSAGWWIPKAGFDEWLRFVCAEVAEPDLDGTVSVAEAAALASAAGLRGFRAEILSMCIRGEMAGAVRDGATYRMPLASVDAWISDLNAAVRAGLENLPQEVGEFEPAAPWWRSADWLKVWALLVVAAFVWCIAASV